MGDRDWSVFLAEKLALPWTADRVAMSLKGDVIKQVESKWSVMEPHVKLRVMLAVLGVKRAEEQKELWDAFSHLLTTATEDTDDWVSVMALVIKGITPQGGSSEATHSAYAGCCAEIRKLLAALPPGALSDLPPLDSLYISGPNPNGEGGPQCRNPHFVDRAPFVPTEYGLGSVTAAAASGAANEPQHKEVKKAPTLTAGLARTGLAKASTPRSRDGMGGSWGGGGSTEGRERKVVVEEAEEDDEGGFHEVAGAGGGKRRRGKGGGEPKAKRGRKPAADAVPQPAQTHAGEEEEDDDGGNSGPAPFGEDSSTSHMANLPPAGYSDTSGGGGGGGGGGSPPAEAPVDPWSNFAPAPPAPAPAPPPVQAKPEGMSEWTGKLKSISGLLELVRTSKMSEGEITAVVDFIQGNKANPFADGVNERRYIIREETVEGVTTSISFVMNYGDGKWSVKKNSVRS